MAYLNKVFLIGNLTRDPELRVTPKGTAICTCTIAVTRRSKNEAGEQTEETAFVDFEAWSKQGELVSKYCSKGSPVMIEGRLKLDQWEDKTSGQKRSKLKVVMENVQFLSSRGDQQGGGQQQGAGQQESQPAQNQQRPPPAQQQQRGAPPPPRREERAPAYEENIDEDVPF